MRSTSQITQLFGKIRPYQYCYCVYIWPSILPRWTYWWPLLNLSANPGWGLPCPKTGKPQKINLSISTQLLLHMNYTMNNMFSMILIPSYTKVSSPFLKIFPAAWYKAHLRLRWGSFSSLSELFKDLSGKEQSSEKKEIGILCWTFPAKAPLKIFCSFTVAKKRSILCDQWSQTQNIETLFYAMYIPKAVE